MPSYAHKKLIEQIIQLDTPPSDSTAFAEWIKAGQHLDFLKANANSDEIVVYGSGEYTCVHSLIVPNDSLTPLNQDDLLGWSEAFMNLSKLIIEGFEVKYIRTKLNEAKIPYKEQEQSIALLEKWLEHSGNAEPSLSGLRTIQLIRSKVKGHADGTEAKQIIQKAISEHGSFAEHFKNVCEIVSQELKAIEASMLIA